MRLPGKARVEQMNETVGKDDPAADVAPPMNTSARLPWSRIRSWTVRAKNASRQSFMSSSAGLVTVAQSMGGSPSHTRSSVRARDPD